MQSGLGIIILPRKAQIEHKRAQARGVLFRQAGAERFRFPGPYYFVVAGPADLPRRAQRISMDIVNVNGSADWHGRSQHRQRQVAQPDDLLEQLARGVVFAGQMALFVIKVAREGAADDILFDPLAERIIAVADDPDDAGAPPFRVIAVTVSAIADQQAHLVVAVTDGLGTALALQPVVASADVVVVSCGVVQDFAGAVAVQIVAVVDAALGRFAPLAAGQAVQPVIVVLLVQAGIAVIGNLDEPSGRVVAIGP